MTATRLLLVDDDRLALATLSASLKALGYSVVTADSGEAALERAAEASFDLAILDIRMPGLSGTELCHLLERRHHLPSMFLSAYGDREQVAEAVREGGLAYLMKPVDAPHAMPAIETALARARNLAALTETRGQLEQALAGDRHISIAVGLRMAQRGLAERAAFDALRAEARSERRKLAEYCAEIVARAAPGA